MVTLLKKKPNRTKQNKRKLGKIKKIILIIISLFLVFVILVATAYITNYDGRFRSSSPGGGAFSPIGGAALALASADYTQDNGMFGLTAGSVVPELYSMEPDMSFKIGTIPLKYSPSSVSVSVTPIFCKNSQGVITYGIDLNPKDTDCQGILFINATQGGCNMMVVLKEAEPAPVMILGAPIQSQENYYSDIATTKACSLKTSIRSRKSEKYWVRDVFPPFD